MANKKAAKAAGKKAVNKRGGHPTYIKLGAVEQLLNGTTTAKQLAEDYEVSESAIYQWKKKYGGDTSPAPPEATPVIVEDNDGDERQEFRDTLDRLFDGAGKAEVNTEEYTVMVVKGDVVLFSHTSLEPPVLTHDFALGEGVVRFDLEH